MEGKEKEREGRKKKEGGREGMKRRSKKGEGNITICVCVNDERKAFHEMIWFI